MAATLSCYLDVLLFLSIASPVPPMAIRIKRSRVDYSSNNFYFELTSFDALLFVWKVFFLTVKISFHIFVSRTVLVVCENQNYLMFFFLSVGKNSSFLHSIVLKNREICKRLCFNEITYETVKRGIIVCIYIFVCV